MHGTSEPHGIDVHRAETEADRPADKERERLTKRQGGEGGRWNDMWRNACTRSRSVGERRQTTTSTITTNRTTDSIHTFAVCY